MNDGSKVVSMSNTEYSIKFDDLSNTRLSEVKMTFDREVVDEIASEMERMGYMNNNNGARKFLAGMILEFLNSGLLERIK